MGIRKVRRRLLRALGVSYGKIAARVGCSKRAVAHVVQGRTWRHVS